MSSLHTRNAFKYDFGPAQFKWVERIEISKNGNFVKLVLAITVLVHLLILLLNPKWFFSPPKFDFDENMAVDIDFVSDLSVSSPRETSLPNAVKSEETAVPSNILPQLPKKFEVEEQKKIDEKPFVEEKDPKVADDVAKKQVAAPEKEVVVKTESDPNKLTPDELKLRQIREKLRLDNKLDQMTKAQNSKLATLKDDLSKEAGEKNSGTGAIGVNKIRETQYGALMYAAIKKNWSLPKTYQNGRIYKTELQVTVNGTGEQVDIKIKSSSGFDNFDQFVIDTIQKSVPLPKPPSALVGQPLAVVLSNKTEL